MHGSLGRGVGSDKGKDGSWLVVDNGSLIPKKKLLERHKMDGPKCYPLGRGGAVNTSSSQSGCRLLAAQEAPISQTVNHSLAYLDGSR